MIESKDAAQPTPAAQSVTSESDAAATSGAQDRLTNSVGQRLTREQHDSQAPWWKRLLGKG